MQELMKKSLTGSRYPNRRRSDDMEYISKDKTLKKLQMQLLDLEADQDKGEYSELCENRGARDALDVAINDIRTIKGEDVQPVKRGRCVVDNEGYERCSVCNEHETGMRYFTFCPRCGAKMGGEQND